MNPEYFAFADGTVTHWDFADLDVSRKPREQYNELKEDMAQVSYGEGLLLDIGWYPSFDADGAFRVVLVRDGVWDAPIYSRSCQSWESLRKIVEQAVGVASKEGEPTHRLR